MPASAMPPPRRRAATAEQVQKAKQLLESERRLPDSVILSGARVQTADLRKDQQRFDEQTEFLDKIGFLPILITVATAPSSHDHVEVPVDFHICERIDISTVADVRNDVANWPLKVRSVPAVEARKTFIDRLAEALAWRAVAAHGGSGSSPPGGHPVSVTSNHLGDEILYAAGHFYSTRTHFGFSMCSGTLPANRYSFGIQKPSGPQFHPVLVSVPLQNAPFHVPLP